MVLSQLLMLRFLLQSYKIVELQPLYESLINTFEVRKSEEKKQKKTK